MLRCTILAFIASFISLPLFSKSVPLSYKNFIALVLEKNLNIKIVKLEEDLKKEEIKKETGEFLPYIKTRIYKDFLEDSFGEKGDVVALSSEIYGKLYSGTTYSLSYLYRDSDWDYPSSSGELTLKLSQPFLKNFGISINRSEIEKAKLRLKITEKKIEDFINSKVYEASIVYWKLYNSYYKLKAAQESLQNAKNIHFINREKFKIGMIPESDLLESLAEVKSREEELITLREEFNNLNDELKKFFDNLTSENVYMPTTEPFVLEEEVSEKKAVEIALKNRYEVLKNLYERDIQKIEVDFRKNQRLPELNLSLSAKAHGENHSFSKKDWEVALEFRYPIGNRINTSMYEMAKVKLMQIDFEKKEIKNRIVLEVKKALRELISNKKRIEATEKALSSAYEKLKIETEKFKQGLSTPFKVFHFQRDYTAAKYRYIDAKTDYMISLYHLKKVMGVNLWDTL